MKRILVRDLKVNSYFDAPLYLNEEYVILSPDIPVSLELVNRLKAWNYREVLTEGSEAEGPQGLAVEDPSAVVTRLDETLEEKESRSRVAAFYLQLINQTEQIYTKLMEENALDVKAASDRVKEIVDVSKDSRDQLLACLAAERQVENYLLSHCAATAVLAVAVGAFLKLPPHRLIELGTAAMLHKVGMTKLPSALYLSTKVFGPPERKALVAHPVAAYRLLKGFSVNENIARAVLEHQERSDGSGYPRGLKGDAISGYARILSVASSYVAATSKRPYRAAMDGHSAITDLLRANRPAYDEQVLKALAYTLSVYPVGMYVLLNNGVRGVVCRANPEDARCPIVKPITDQDGKRVVEAALIKTSIEKQILISRALQPPEIAQI